MPSTVPQRDETPGDLWEEIFRALEFHRYRQGHPADVSAQAALNRIAAKCLGTSERTFEPSNCRVHKEFLTTQQLTGLKRYHPRCSPARDCEPIVVIEFNGFKWVIDGNTRVNKWIETGSQNMRCAIVITPKDYSQRCNWSALAVRASFPHWHFCDLESGHEGKHRCKSCKAVFGR
jgi:hypothetical protein